MMMIKTQIGVIDQLKRMKKFMSNQIIMDQIWFHLSIKSIKTVLRSPKWIFIQTLIQSIHPTQMHQALEWLEEGDQDEC